ncbi:MAG: hypothetical protein NT166_19835 [Candidatus Aminicenantes bacterium]|nr:hypothetical protein [Candidatus Aminicenantes bacterium]
MAILPVKLSGFRLNRLFNRLKGEIHRLNCLFNLLKCPFNLLKDLFNRLKWQFNRLPGVNNGFLKIKVGFTGKYLASTRFQRFQI